MKNGNTVVSPTVSARFLADIPGKKGFPRVVRTTLVLPTPLDQNLEIYCLRAGISKPELIKSLLSAFLEQHGLQPSKTPRVEISY